MKINRKLLIVIFFSLALAITFSFLEYKAMKKAAEPEATIKIAYYKDGLKRGSKLREDDIYLKDTPVSLAPHNSLTNLSIVNNKTLLIDATRNDFALESDMIARGETKDETDEFYQLGIKIESIDNFLGTQFKYNTVYGLLYLDPLGKSQKVFKIKITGATDSIGKIVVEGGEKTIEEINIAIETYEELVEIAEMKRSGSFELVKVPEDFWITLAADKIEEDSAAE